MRGLTPFERELLSVGDIEFEFSDEVAEKLAKEGRAIFNKGEEWDTVSATDLGRLALRVCPVEES